MILQAIRVYTVESGGSYMNGKGCHRTLIAAFILLLACVNVGAGQNSAGGVPGIKKDCATCHVEIEKGPGLKKALSGLCLDCHPDRMAPNEHKVDIVPAREVGKLPLFDGRMTCATCHDSHSNPYGKLLRVPQKDLCFQCHPY